MKTIWNTNLTRQQHMIANNNTTGQTDTSRQETFFADNDTMCNLTQIINFCSVPNNGICHRTTVDTSI